MFSPQRSIGLPVTKRCIFPCTNNQLISSSSLSLQFSHRHVSRASANYLICCQPLVFVCTFFSYFLCGFGVKVCIDPYIFTNHCTSKGTSDNLEPCWQNVTLDGLGQQFFNEYLFVARPRIRAYIVHKYFQSKRFPDLISPNKQFAFITNVQLFPSLARVDSTEIIFQLWLLWKQLLICYCFSQGQNNKCESNLPSYILPLFLCTYIALFPHFISAFYLFSLPLSVRLYSSSPRSFGQHLHFINLFYVPGDKPIYHTLFSSL